MTSRSFSILVLLAIGSTSACAHSRSNPYESASSEQRAAFKKVMLPLPEGTKFKISQGAFGQSTHHDPGHEYAWDFDVPYGTPVLSVEDGTVLQVWEPNQGGGCDPKFNDSPHNIKINTPTALSLSTSTSKAR